VELPEPGVLSVRGFNADLSAHVDSVVDESVAAGRQGPFSVPPGGYVWLSSSLTTADGRVLRAISR